MRAFTGTGLCIVRLTSQCRDSGYVTQHSADWSMRMCLRVSTLGKNAYLVNKYRLFCRIFSTKGPNSQNKMRYSY